MINILEAFDIRVTWQISSFLGKGTVGENSGVFTRNAGKGNTNSFYLRHFKTDWALCIFFSSVDSLYLFFYVISQWNRQGI